LSWKRYAPPELSNRLNDKCMKKIRLPGTPMPKIECRQLVLIMKLTFVFLFLFCMHLSAKVRSQTTVTLHLQNTALNKVLLEIERQTDFRFLFDDDLKVLHRKVNVNVRDKLVT